MSYLGRSAKLSLKAQEKVSFLATAGQTSKTGLSYVPSFVEVYVNGILLTDTTDFTATNGNSVTFTVALALNDEVTVVSLKTFTVADHYTKSDANTLLAAKAKLTKSATAPSSPAAGDMWFDTTSGVNAMKVYDGTAWDQLSTKFTATGGTVTTGTIGGTLYKIHTFLSSGTFVADASGSVEYLVVAAGGGGGGAGGGGAGGLLTNLSSTKLSVNAGNYAITVGAGGAGAANGASNRGHTGGNSVFSTVTAIGGGGGGSYVANADNTQHGVAGGSGGGGGFSNSQSSGGAGTAGQGNAGGLSTHLGSNPYSASGGGGAGAAGQGTVSESTSGAGGVGLQNNINGTNHYWAGGGGGGSQGSNSVSGNGGLGGGGSGAVHTPGTAGTGGGSALNTGGTGTTGTNGTSEIGGAGGANTGGGGGGMGISVHLGGTGGSGIVIVRYAV